MLKIKTVLLLGMLTLLVAGCASSLITNLTPSAMPRNASGQYLVELKLDSSQQTPP